jgi:hypothetical protein
MTWAITIATFLATLVAALLGFFIFSRREQILEILREQRVERRTTAAADLELSKLDEPLSHDKALAENTSRHGARVITEKPWLPNDHVLVKLPRREKRSRARIAYCNALRKDAFAIGLQFFSAVDDWAISLRSDAPNGGLAHPYRK